MRMQNASQAIGYWFQHVLSKTVSAIFLCLLALPGECVEVDLEEVTVQVQREGETVVVDVSFLVPATQIESWNVLTDFDHMHEFISNLQSSKVVSRQGTRLQVAQAGKARKGLLSFSFDSVREVDLHPHQKIQSRLLQGANLRKLDGLTLLRSEGGMTRVQFHGESISNVWIPPIIGEKFIGNEVQEQFREMRLEIMRRRRPADSRAPA